MPLRIRKIIYMALALGGSVVWLPMSLLAIPFIGIGIFGLFALSALYRGIYVLPVVRRVRSYYSIPIGMGVFIMGSFVATGWAVEEELGTHKVPLITGLMLFLAGFAVLIEMYFFSYLDDEDRAVEPARPSEEIRS